MEALHARQDRLWAVVQLLILITWLASIHTAVTAELPEQRAAVIACSVRAQHLHA